MKKKSQSIKPTNNKALGALAVFGGLFTQSGMFNAKRGSNPTKRCLCCGKSHRHNNAFCKPKCCETWCTANPHQGRLNHSHAEDGSVLAAYNNPQGLVRGAA